jgi:hypothetical protein
MAGIERSDAIKRPTDSTLTPRTLDRNSEPVLRIPADSIDALRPSLPAIAVVVEQTVMGSRDKPLYDLVLSLNQQWVKVQSERPFPPGTVLMVEATPDNQLRVLPRVDPVQLNQMMQASLQFWQAHSLPRAHTTQMPALPAMAALSALVGDAPQLQALIQWLTQTPPLSARNVAQWMQEFSPLARLQPMLSNLPSTPTMPGATGLTAPTSSTSISSATAVQTLLPLLNSLARSNPTTATLPNTGHPMNPGTALVIMSVLPGATALPATAVVLNAALTSTGTQAQGATGSAPATTNPATNTAPPATSIMTGQNSSPMPLILVVLPGSQAQLASSPLALLQNPAVATNQTGAKQPQAPTDALGSGVQPTAAGQGGANPANTGQPSLLVQSMVSTLPSPTEGSIKTGNENSREIPLEIRLSQWLAVLDSRIRQHPASLQQALAQQAQKLLSTPTPGYAPGVNVQMSGTPQPGLSQESLHPLLQLRTLLEGMQGKLQNNAIQQSLGALAQPDAPGVQQLSIPMIWLGPNHWLNMEWWQEKSQSSSDSESSASKRKWRFRLFFELPPLAPLCADLHWSPEHTDLIFWSQDQGTLGVIHSHMDKLEQWTQGLGERSMHTRHGMPPKKTTPEPDQFKPLVDIRT